MALDPASEASITGSWWPARAIGESLLRTRIGHLAYNLLDDRAQSGPAGSRLPARLDGRAGSVGARARCPAACYRGRYGAPSMGSGLHRGGRRVFGKDARSPWGSPRSADVVGETGGCPGRIEA